MHFKAALYGTDQDGHRADRCPRAARCDSSFPCCLTHHAQMLTLESREKIIHSLIAEIEKLLSRMMNALVSIISFISFQIYLDLWEV